LSVTSDLGLTMTTSNAGSDASYSFSSVAKIQVEENYITKRWVKDGSGQLVPGLRSKVYDYYVQTISQSVLKKRSVPYSPLGTSRHRNSEQVNEELQSFATQDPDAAFATRDPTVSSIVPAPTGSLETSPEPPSPGRKASILHIANSPHLQLPMEGFGVTAPATTPPASPSPGLAPALDPSRLCYYDNGGDCWHHLCHVPPEVVSRGCAMCSMFNYLFVVAGCEGTGRMQRPSNRVFCYDPLTNIWREICPLNQARPHCKLVALDGHLYAIGGECLYTVERYDPRQDRWTFTAPLPYDTFAVAHTATVCNGEIYVTGGTLRYVLLRYTARSDSWRVNLASGGKDRTVETTGIGVYRCSAKAKLWYECATYTMPDPPGFQCAVVGSLVHCIGRHFHIRFLANHISPRFGTKELQPFPSPRGSLLPAVLVLPESGMAQT
ncbi:Kelch domain-containing protein 7A, partial [Apaloderma vittatum]